MSLFSGIPLYIYTKKKKASAVMDDESAAAFRDICGFPRLNNPLLTVIYCMTGTSGLLFLGFLSPSTLKHVTDSFRSVPT